MNYLDSLKQQHPEITKYSDDEIISVLPKIDPSLSGMEPQALRSFALAEQEPSGLWGLAKSGYHNVKGSRAVADAAGDLNDLNDPEFYEQDLQPRKVQTGSFLGMSGDELRRRSVASTGGEDQLMQEAQRRLDKGTEQYQKAAQYKLSPTTEQFLTGSLNPDSDILSDLMADPVTIIAEIGAQSAYGSVESLLQGAAMGVVGGPAGMAVGSGTGSARIEFANSLVEGLREAGVDVTDARKLRAQLAESPDLFAQVADKAKKRAASVGALDGAAMGLASVPMGIGRNATTRVGTNLAFQGAAQSGLGAGGEALGQYIADGQISDMRAIAAEAAGELVTAPVVVAAATYGGMNGRNASAADRAAASTDEAIQQAKQFEDQLNRTSFFSGKPNGQVTAADMGLQMPEQRDWSQYEASPTERPMAEAEPQQQQEQPVPRQSARDMSGLEGLIITADRMGFLDEAALLRTSQRLYRQADEARARGDDAAASRFVERGNRLYREATETNDQVREIADQFPVPYVAQGEVTSGELVPSNAPNFTMPEPDIEGEGVTLYMNSNQPLLTQQTARLESNNPETQFIMGRDQESRPERTFTPVPDEVEGVGRNTVERTAQAKTNALPVGNATRAITPDQYRNVMERARLALRTPVSRRTPEMTQALEVREQVRAGQVAVSENAQPDTPSIAGEQIDQEWTRFTPESGTLNVPRAEMPQVKAENRGALVNYLNARGIEHQQAEIDPRTLKPTQAEFSPAKVQKAREFTGGDRSILVSADGHVVDGHHQWMAKRDTGEPVKVIQLQAPIDDLVPLIRDFPSSEQDGGAQAATPQQPQLKYKTNGSPFASERAAQASAAFRDNRDYASVVPVDGGFAVQINTQARDQAETQAAKSAQVKSEQAKRRMYREPDTAKDDMLDAIALMGGIDRAEAEAEGIDPAVFNRRAAGIRPIFTRQNGDSFDGMAERLAQYGYLDARADRLDDLRAKLNQAINGGRKIMTPEGYEALAEKELAAEAQLQEEHARLADDITSDEAWAGEAYAMAAEAGVPINVIDAILEQYSADPIATLVELNDAINEVENARAAQAGEGTQGRSADTEIPWNEPGNLTPEQAAEIFGAVEPEPLLTSYTEADLQAQADAQSAAEQAEADAQRRAEQKAQADAEVGDFTLSGSNRPADVAASRGQNDMFGLGGTPRAEQLAAQQQPEPEPPEPVKSRVSVDTFNSWKRQGTAGTRKGWTIFKDDVRNQYALMRKTLDENAAGGGYEGADMVSGFTTRAQAEEWIDENAQQSAPQQQAEAETAGQPALQQAEPTLQPIESAVDAVDDLNQRINNGETVTAAEVRRVFEYVAGNQETVKAELNKLKKDDLKRLVSGHVWSDTKKAELVDRAYDSLIGDFRFIGNESGVVTSTGFGAENRLNQAREHVNALTDEQVAEYAKSRKAMIDERMAERKQRIDALKNPQTLAEYRESIRMLGMDKLTPEQRATYDRLVAEETMAQRQPQSERAGLKTDEQVELGEPTEGTHGKTGETIFNVKVITRLGKEKFKEAAGFARSMGGGYFRGTGSFYFKSREDAELFSGWVNGESVDLSERNQQRQEQKQANAADKLKAMADRIEQQASEALNADRKENTIKRMDEGERARSRAKKELQIAGVLKAIPDSDTVVLKNATQKVQIELLETLTRSLVHYAPEEQLNKDNYSRRTFKDEVTPEQRVQHARMPLTAMSVNAIRELANQMLQVKGYVVAARGMIKGMQGRRPNEYVNFNNQKTINKVLEFVEQHSDQYSPLRDAAADYKRLQRMGITSPPLLRTALLEYMTLRDSVTGADTSNRLQQLERDLQRRVIGNRNAFNDFFPTPEAVAEEVVAQAEIEPGMRVLEPSAGNGMLADAAKAAGAEVDVVEMGGQLREILNEKGYTLVGDDFLEYQAGEQYDRIVMNPPFSKDQDIEHVSHAYDQLKPGGKLVAIVSSMAGDRSNTRNLQFREWLDSLDAVEQPLPQGAFLSSMNQTGVNTKVLVIEKPLGEQAGNALQTEAIDSAGNTVTAQGVTITVPTIDQQLVDDYNRATHMGRGRDLNAELRSEAEGLLNELAERKYTLDTPEQKAEAKRLIEAYLQAQAAFSEWDARYSANNPSWIVTGRSGRNMDKSNRANERHMDEYTKRVDRLQASRDRIAERLYNMRPREVQENQALSADLRNITQQAGHILADVLEGKNALAADTRKWASPKAHKLIERSLEADRGRTIEHIRELENTKSVQDAGGLVKVFGPRSKAGKLVKELLQAPPALQRRGFESLGIESVVTADKQPEKGMSVEKVQALVDAFQKAYNGNVPLKFKVADTQEELYGKGATIEEYGVIKGSYHPASGEVRLAARNLSEMGDAVETLRHEVLGHYGLNTFTPADKRRILDQLIEARDSEGPLADTWAEIDELYADKSDDIRAEEVFAKVVESEPAKVGRLKAFVDRLLYNLNAALRRVGIIKAPLKLNDVRRMARYVAEGIRAGRRQQQTLPASNEALFRRGGPQPEPGAFAVPEETWANVALRKMADKFRVLKDLQKNIQDAGGTVNESNDAYLAEELFHGKTEEDLRQMRETFIKPLADKMAKFGIEQKDLDQYLYAKHAPERNAHIAEINPELQEAGSGMSDAKAAEIIQQARDSGKLEQYEQLAGMVYDMLETRRETIRSAGLEEGGMIDAWESKYEFYVPLKGFAADEQQDTRARTGSGFNIAGKESKRALGRSSEAASPSSYAIQDLTETLIRRRKNEVGNALLKLVEENPNKGYWQVFTDENPDMDRRIFTRKDPMTGETIEEVREAPIPMAMLSDRYFQTKRDGKTYFIKLEDERLMKAMKNIGPDTSNFLIRSLGAVNRVISSLNTSYNPEFVVGNFARDVQTAVLNLMAEQSRDDGKAMGEKIAKQTVKDIPKAMKAVYRGLRNKDEAKGGEWQKWFREFREAGAKTGWFDMKDIDGQAADLQSLISMSKGGVKGTAMKWFKATGQMVEDLNGAVENAVRLSAYVNARKAGISQAKAASLAKNMTVNFNRRGEVGTTLNALYMFANASIQGSMNFARTMIGLKGQKGDPIWQRLNTAQKVAAGLVMGSYAIAMANRSGAGEDDDGENWYDKVPDYVKERNLVIMKSLLGGEQDGSYWTIPLPYGYNIFHVLGNALEGTTNGNTSIGKAATDLTLATLGSFSPIGFQQSQSLTGTVVRNMTPTIGKPLVDIGFNENFMGTSIYNENFPFGTPKPESQLGRRSTPEGYKAIAEFLNDVSGGSQWRSGYLDINPDVMRYMANYFTGAAGKFLFDKAPNNLYHLATLTPIEARETLFISRVSGRVLPYEDREKFYTRRDEINQTEAEWKGLTGGDRVRFYRDNRQLLALRPLIQSTEKQLKSLRQQRDRVYAMDLPRKEQEARLESIDARMKRVIDRFNRRYVEVVLK